MPELGCHRALWLAVVACAVSAGATAPARAADPIPVGLRACGAETDPGQRLACFDRELARYPAPASKPALQRDANAAPAGPGASSPATAASGTTSAPRAAGGAATVTPAAAPSSARAPLAATSQHVEARIIGIDAAPNEMVLHLDNGQIWQQIQGIAGDLSLRPGDTVTIEKHLGSYWLSGPHVSNMKVRQKS